MSFGVYSQFQTFGQSQELENILKNNSMTLEELLERDNFLFDIKAGAMNAFTEFVWKQPENLEKMIHYIVISNEQMDDNEKSRKFPYIISEIFAIENTRLFDLLFLRHRNESQSSLLSNERLTTIEDDILPEYQMHHEDQCKEDEDYNGGGISGISGTSIQCASFKSKSGMHLNENVRLNILNSFFKYLETPNINDTSMGYYAKILKPVASKYGGEFWDHIVVNNNIISDLLQHINHYQIVEIVVKLLILDYKINDNIYINQKCYNYRKQLLEEMIHQMDKFSDNITMVADITQIFDLLLEQGIQQKLYEPLRELFDNVLKPYYFFKIAKKTGVLSVYKVFSKILLFIQVNSLQDQKTSDLIQIIQQINPLIVTYLQDQENFGLKNLCLVQALEICDKLNNPLLFESMFQAQLYQSLIEYALKYQWNNQLQIYVTSIIKSRIQDEKYCQRILKETDILNQIKKNLIDQPTNSSFKSKCSHGYNGFLKTVGYKILQKQTASKKINQLLQECNNQYDQLEYGQIIEALQGLQQLEQTYLCDVDPKTHMQEAPPDISIDRQIEMLIDSQKEKEDQLTKSEQQ
ncbi:unnamed protein product (macronuclear) [Paramecium tetraurelia]|uniref:Serine/threonine-protein phosphatase 4 regulatory subunit 3-like central domain-containing protein n=1 Tax=Paramecium tetraurelia TaxID=5888 RepID=A0D6N6_PARTE|nr:uncharacterized protein GSPATT00001744001 [Paramecium tetraurelia]CAK78703.1 unnamed protein product [Paramecium tetraurelia]|eukprot:XP_001446100.1 hypothetical protein (macronuclear) [Paramecium tetraurelia strain d4-2]